MAATTPLWVTILLAVMTPVFTLAGVFWTQRTANRRADRDAALRLQHQRSTDEEARLVAVYCEVNVASARAIQMDASTDDAEWQEARWQLDLALFSANMFAPASVIQSLDAFRRLVNQRHSEPDAPSNERQDLSAALLDMQKLFANPSGPPRPDGAALEGRRNGWRQSDDHAAGGK